MKITDKDIPTIVDSFIGQKNMGNLKDFLNKNGHKCSNKTYTKLLDACLKKDEFFVKRAPTNTRVIKNKRELA